MIGWGIQTKGNPMTANTAKTPKNAIIYARRSNTDKVKESVSLASQVEECRAYCKREGLNVVGVYEDDGVSGGVLPRQMAPSARKVRQGLTDALAMIEAGKAAHIVAYKLDRLSRLATGKGLELLALIDKLGGKVALSSEQLPEFATATGEFSLTVLLSVSALYRRLASERMKASKEQAKREGRRTGKAPFGYRNAGEAEELKRIFADYIGGVSIYSIVERLNAERKSYSGGVWWHHTIKLILRNPTYIGKRKDLTPFPAFAPIIDEATFFKAQKLLDANSTTKATNKRIYALSGILRCGACGCSLVALRLVNPCGKVLPYYRCGNRGCGTPLIQMAEYSKLAGVLVNSLVKTSRRETSAEDVQAEKIRANMEALNEKVTSGEIDAETFLSLKAAANKKLSELAALSKTKEASLAVEAGHIEWDKLSDSDKRLALFDRVEEIKVSLDKATVKIRKGWIAANPSTHTKAGTFNFLGAGGFDLGEGFRGKGYDFPASVDFRIEKNGRTPRTFNLSGLAIAVQKIIVETLKDMPNPLKPLKKSPPK